MTITILIAQARESTIGFAREVMLKSAVSAANVTNR